MPIKKETITTESIIYDYKSLFLTSIKKLFLLFIFILAFLCLLVYLTIVTPIKFKIIFGISGLLFLLVLCVTLCIFINKLMDFKSITKMNFKIVIDKLIQKQVETLGHHHMPSEQNVFTFNKYGKFFLCEGVHFSSSKQFAMRETEYFSTSKIDDEFYLIIKKNGKILIVYNTRFFQLYT